MKVDRLESNLQISSDQPRGKQLNSDGQTTYIKSKDSESICAKSSSRKIAATMHAVGCMF